MRPIERLAQLGAWTYMLSMIPLIAIAILGVIATWGDIIRPLIDWLG